jgi:hypothetical protein
LSGIIEEVNYIDVAKPRMIAKIVIVYFIDILWFSNLLYKYLNIFSQSNKIIHKKFFIYLENERKKIFHTESNEN